MVYPNFCVLFHTSTPHLTMVRFVSTAVSVLSWTLVTSFHFLPQTRRNFMHSTSYTTSITKTRDSRSFHALSMTTSSVLGEFIPVTMEELLIGVIPCEVTIKPPPLHNKYYGLRHGESMANLEGIISSDPGRGTTIHGLTETGREQSRQAAKQLLDIVGMDAWLNGQCVFLTSDFTRARQTADEALQQLKILSPALSQVTLPSIETTIALRERYFGQLDAQVLMWYNKVWPIDQIDASNTRYQVESVQQVVERVASLVTTLENRYTNKHIILTSHADTLQIMQTYLAGADPRQFSSYRFKNGEVRDMEVLPEAVPMVYTKVNK